jgi:hypothetical protein
MEQRSFEEINAVMNSSHIQHYISSLKGCLNAGEAVLLNEDVELAEGLNSMVTTIL